jgi:hypothetical protein
MSPEVQNKLALLGPLLSDQSGDTRFEVLLVSFEALRSLKKKTHRPTFLVFLDSFGLGIAHRGLNSV